MAWIAIPEWQTLWKKWDIRICILSSLLTQVILVFISPQRKKMSRIYVTISTWFAYLLADAVAMFCVGLIANGQCEGNRKIEDLHAFWAPFLLLHLGGPDTITAFALEDNELWIRHLMNLVIQSSVVIYVILQSLPENKFWGPMCLILAVGLFKYAERSYALYLASLTSFRESVTLMKHYSNYARRMREFAWMEENQVPAKIRTLKHPETNQERNSSTEEESHMDEMQGSNSSHNPYETNQERNSSTEESHMDEMQGSNSSHNPYEIIMVEKAYEFFNKFKGLIVDLIYNFHDRDDSRRFFLDISEEEKAYRMIEIELSFIYDVFYTKAPILHSRKGYFLRLIGFTSIVAAFFLFGFSNKDKLHHIDVGVTYALLTSAVFLEVTAFLNLIFSDWTIALLKKFNSKSAKSLIYKTVTRNIFFKKSRWSESISQLSLLNFCLCKRWKWVENAVECLRLKDFLDGIQYKTHTPLSHELKELIFRELKSKSRKATNLPATKEICSSRGTYILNDYGEQVKGKLSRYFQVEYDASLLMWHIATDILYHHNVDPHEAGIIYPELCKTLSDYMLYLLVIQPTAISAVASVAQTSYRDTCAEADKFFREFPSVEAQPETNEAKSLLKLIGKLKLKAEDKELKEACRKLLQVDTSIEPSKIKGLNKSVFFYGVMLAKDLLEFGPDKWKIMSKVWVELLCYSAGHCRATNHAQHVSKGGELVTLVWLLMVHFGLAEQFSIQSSAIEFVFRM